MGETNSRRSTAILGATVRDDILTSVAGPVSNFLTAALAVIGLMVIARVSPLGHALVPALASGASMGDVAAAVPPEAGIVVPICLLLYAAVEINVLLGVFNLIPATTARWQPRDPPLPVHWSVARV